MGACSGARPAGRLAEAGGRASEGAEPAGRGVHPLRRNPVAVTGRDHRGVPAGGGVRAATRATQRGDSFEALRASLRPDSIPGPMPGFPLGSDQNGRERAVPDDPGLAADVAGRRARHVARAGPPAWLSACWPAPFGGWWTPRCAADRCPAVLPQPAAGHLDCRAGGQASQTRDHRGGHRERAGVRPAAARRDARQRSSDYVLAATRAGHPTAQHRAAGTCCPTRSDR